MQRRSRDLKSILRRDALPVGCTCKTNWVRGRAAGLFTLPVLLLRLVVFLLGVCGFSFALERVWRIEFLYFIHRAQLKRERVGWAASHLNTTQWTEHAANRPKDISRLSGNNKKKLRLRVFFLGDFAKVYSHPAFDDVKRHTEVILL